MNIFRKIARNRKIDKHLKKQWSELRDEGDRVLDDIDQKIEKGELDPAPYEMPGDLVERVLESETQVPEVRDRVQESPGWTPIKVLPFAYADSTEVEGELPSKFEYEDFDGEIYVDLKNNVCIYFELKRKELADKYNSKTIFIRIEGREDRFEGIIEDESARIILEGIDLKSFDPKMVLISLTIPEVNDA